MSLKERLKVNGDILISLHVNSEPINNGGKINGIEMYTSTLTESIKSTKVNALSKYLFAGMQNLNGININSELKSNNLFLLRESKIPGLIIQLGYLTNKSDLKFITNEAKQDELAEAIVNGIELYKNKSSVDQKIELNETKLGSSFKLYDQDIPFINRKTVNSNTDKKNENIKVSVKNKTIANITTSEIGVAKLYFLINEKIYTEAEAMKFTPAFIAQLSDINGVGNLKNMYDLPNIDKSINNFVIWFGKEPKLADYAFKDKAISQKYNDKTIEGKIIGFTYADNKEMSSFLVKTTNGETVKANVEAKFANQTATMIAKDDNVSIKIYNANYWKDNEYPVLTNYKISKGGKLLYDRWPKVEFKNSLEIKSNDNTNLAENGSSQYVVNRPKEIPNSYAYNLLKDLKANNDSLRMNTVFDNTIILVGNVKMNVDGYSITAKIINGDKYSNLIKVHLATVTTPEGSILSADEFEFDVKTKLFTVTKMKGFYANDK